MAGLGDKSSTELGDKSPSGLVPSSLQDYFGPHAGLFAYASGSSIPRGIGGLTAWRDPHPCLACGAAVIVPGVHLAWHIKERGDG